MKAPLPYHFCQAPECHEMVTPGHRFCDEHEPALTAAASQQSNIQPDATRAASPETPNDNHSD
jgi:hypothetical protein